MAQGERRGDSKRRGNGFLRAKLRHVVLTRTDLPIFAKCFTARPESIVSAFFLGAKKIIDRNVVQPRESSIMPKGRPLIRTFPVILSIFPLQNAYCSFKLF